MCVRSMEGNKMIMSQNVNKQHSVNRICTNPAATEGYTENISEIFSSFHFAKVCCCLVLELIPDPTWRCVCVCPCADKMKVTEAHFILLTFTDLYLTLSGF